MNTKTTLVLCLIGAIGSLSLGFGGLGWSLMSTDDALIFPLVIGPYAVFASLAVWRRLNAAEIRVLLVGVILVMVSGLWGFGLAFYRRSGSLDGSMAMELSPLFVSALHWIFASVICIGVCVTAFIKSRRRWGIEE